MNLLRSVLLFVVILSLPLTAAEWNVEEDLTAARELFERNLDSIRNRDRDAYLATYLQSETLARTGPGGIALGYEGLEASAGSGWPDTFEGRALTLVPVSPGVVYGTYRYRVRYGNVEQTGLSERVFVETPAGWRIAVTTAFASPPEVPPAPITLIGGILIDGRGGAPIADSIVVIRGGSIECAGGPGDCEVPDDADVIDTTGRWVTPGLVDAHVHYGQTGWADARPDALDVSDRFPYPETIATLRRNPAPRHRQFLCSGVTSVLDAGGYAWSVGLQNESIGTARVPNIATAGPLLSTIDHPPLNLGGEQQIIGMRDAPHARELVRYIASLGSGSVKVWGVARRDQTVGDLRALLMAVGEEARDHGLRLLIHATELEMARLALRAGADVLVHGIGDHEIDDEILQLLRDNGTVYVPTLLVGRGYARMFESAATGTSVVVDDPNGCTSAGLLERITLTPGVDVSITSEQIEASWDRTRERERIGAINLRRIHQEGGIVAAGTDAGNPLTLHGPSIYAELEAMVEAGLTPAEVLVTATRNGARAMGRRDLGTIEEGQVADLLILTADPLESISNLRRLERVVLRGVVRSLDELTAEENSGEGD
jgi:imidazolonepropionase-like amidohydrolase